MDRVTVFPDGELAVQAVATAPGNAAFTHGVNAGAVCALSEPAAACVVYTSIRHRCRPLWTMYVCNNLLA